LSQPCANRLKADPFTMQPLLASSVIGNLHTLPSRDSRYRADATVIQHFPF
jgi:hypothetical protein